MAIWSSSKKDLSNDSTSSNSKTQAQPALLKAEESTEKIYKREVWWVEHRIKLTKYAIIFLIVLEATIGLIGIWSFADYYLIDFVAERQLATTFLEGSESLANANIAQVPVSLNVTDPKTVQSGSRFDILAFAENGNPDWTADLTFHFEYGDISTPTQTVAINQDSTIALTELALDGARTRSVKLVMEDVKWERISPHDIKDPIAWKADRWNFEFQDTVHANDIVIGGKTFGHTTFNFVNNTGFGYYDVPITVVLKRGGSIIGVNRTTLSKVPALSSTLVQMDWFDATPNASSIEIYPELNLFDDEMYIPTSADEEKDRRDTVKKR